MAVMKLNNLVLRGVSVACDVVTGLERIGSKQAMPKTPAMFLSSARHFSLSDPYTVSDPGMCHEPTGNAGAALAVSRAGRSGSSAGVLDSRSLAIFARRAILSGWSLAVGELCPMVAWVQAPVDEVIPEHLQAFLRGVLQPDQLWQLPQLTRDTKRGEVGTDSYPPASGMPRLRLTGR